LLSLISLVTLAAAMETPERFVTTLKSKASAKPDQG